MTNLLIGAAIGIAALLIVIAIIKASKKQTVVVTEEVAPILTAEERAVLETEFSGNNVPFLISDDVEGETSNLVLDWVDVHGTRYTNISKALLCKKLTSAERNKLIQLDATLAVLCIEEPKRYLDVKDMLDGKVYVYEPCKMKLDGQVDGQASRIALEITRNKELTTAVSTIYVSKHDVTTPKDRYEFDMANPDDAESFHLLVRDNQDYELEMKELAVIEERIAHYNTLVAKDRVGIEADGSIVIFPPSPEEIKAARQSAQPIEAPISTAETIKEAIEEFVSSSSL